MLVAVIFGIASPGRGGYPAPHLNRVPAKKAFGLLSHRHLAEMDGRHLEIKGAEVAVPPSGAKETNRP